MSGSDDELPGVAPGAGPRDRPVHETGTGAPGQPEAARNLRIHAALLVAQLAFAGFAVIGKSVLTRVDPLAVAVLRIWVSAPLLLLLAAWKERTLPRGRDWPWLAALGLLGVFGNQLLFVLGLSKTTATNASLLAPAIPVFAVLLGAALRVEAFGARRAAGTALAVSGALVVLDPRRMQLRDEVTLGNLLILANCLAYASFLVLQRPLLRRLPPLTTIAWAFVFGGIGITALGGSAVRSLDPGALPDATRWGLAYVALVPSAIGHGIMVWGVARSSPSLVATYTTLQPVLSASLAAVFLGERLGWNGALGFVLIALGLRVVARNRERGSPGRERS